MSGFSNGGLPNYTPGFSISACHYPLGSRIEFGGASEKHRIIKPHSRYCWHVAVGGETVASLRCGVGVCAIVVDAVYPVILVTLVGA